MPVMSLMILSRGVNISNLALIVGIYSLTVVVLEFPSGVFCDLVGRKRTFLISCVLMLLSLLVILFYGKGTLLLSAAFLIQGAGRAFSSGSLDALVIERSIKEGEDTAVAKISGELGFLECAGIAVGSLIGGVLGGIGSRYNVNLVVMAGIYLLIILLVLTSVKESSNRNHSPVADFRNQMQRSLNFSWKCVPVRILMVLVFFTGMVLFSVETYWQPGLLHLMKSEKIWLMGFVSFLGFGFTALSSQLGAKLLQRFSKKSDSLWWYSLFLAKILFGTVAATFGLWLHPALFVCNYSLFYFIHSGGSVIENALLSKHTTNEMRASIMSLFSLFFQFGGLTASVLSGSLLANTALPGIWLTFGISMVICAIGTAIYKATHP